jgi:hypothetical protein
MGGMKIVLGVVLTLALCYGAVIVSGEVESSEESDVAALNSVSANGPSLSSSATNNATDVTANPMKIPGNSPGEQDSSIEPTTTILLPEAGQSSSSKSSSSSSGATPTPTPDPTLENETEPY